MNSAMTHGTKSAAVPTTNRKKKNPIHPNKSPHNNKNQPKQNNKKSQPTMKKTLINKRSLT